ncbi:MAG TPA: LPS assembly protein LptD [Gammaproteobacteria bacterium]|nr:LPS assembly protein LptD [Gammaproteobacteria bacterium]
MYRGSTCILVILLLAATPAVAAPPAQPPPATTVDAPKPGSIGYNQWGTCPAQPASPVPPAPPGTAPDKQQPTRLSAEKVDGQVHGVSILTGQPKAVQGSRQLTAERMRYNATTGEIHARDQVQFASPDMTLHGNNADYDLDTASGNFENADFFLPRRHGRGDAQKIEMLDSNRSFLTDMHYTTCPVGHQDWMLDAGDMLLDQATNTGIGHNVVIDFFGVPIFWTPYINFPLNDERKSGFLAPSISYSNRTGVDLATPYYFNLAPNYDATFTPRVITRRGFDLGGEFRYLLEGGSQGQVDFDYLPHDKLADRERGLLSFSDNTPLGIGTGWAFNSAYNWLSDSLYYQDLGNSLVSISRTYMERHAAVKYGSDDGNLNFLAQMETFQIVDPAISPLRYPYKQLPELSLDWQSDAASQGPQFELQTGLVRFQQDLRIGALRTDIEPSISDNFGSAGYYLTPTAAYRFTHYTLDENTLPGQETGISRSLPIFSLDSGLSLERGLDNGSYIQTLEPRLYYLYVPYRDQSAIPRFDTLQPQFSFLQLFTDNRFFGADRQGDANQLSYALTSRLLDGDSGFQVLEGSLGEIRYFKDRRVNLQYCPLPTSCSSPTPPDTALFSDLVANVTLNLNERWSTSYDQQWDHVTRQTDLASVGIQYHPDYNQVVNAAYRYNRKLDLKQTDISFVWPLSNNWSTVGRWNYDVVNRMTLESFVGLQYDSCCWALQIVHRRFITQTGTANSQYFVELQLKGLATLGHRLEDFLQNGILGYSEPLPSH